MIDRYNHIQFLINRYDHYYDGVNNKSAFYLGLNTFIISGLITIYYVIGDKTPFSLVETLCFAAATLCGFISIVFLFWAIIPFLRSGNIKDEYKTYMFFSSISKFERKVFAAELKSQGEQSVLDDMANQTYELACGLDLKYSRIRKASYWLMIEFLLLIPISLIIFYKFNSH